MMIPGELYAKTISSGDPFQFERSVPVPVMTDVIDPILEQELFFELQLVITDKDGNYKGKIWTRAVPLPSVLNLKLLL